MIKIWSMKKNEEQAGRKKSKVSAAQIRLQKDLTQLELPPTIKIHFPDPAKQVSFELYIVPDEGFFKGGVYPFSVNIPDAYPHEPPKIKCTKKIYHPNIDLDGNVCLNILREDWKPVLDLTAVMNGLNFLFLEPNPDDPLNKDAANELKQNREQFKKSVTRSMAGGSVGSVTFEDIRVQSFTMPEFKPLSSLKNADIPDAKKTPLPVTQEANGDVPMET